MVLPTSSTAQLGGSRASRQSCVRPQAAASPDVKADGGTTAEARRRLARQFRRHKLQPQPPAPAHLSAAAAARVPSRLRVQGLRPRPLPGHHYQQHHQHGQAQEQQWHPQQWQQLPIGASPSSAAAAAAARQLLEWQFSLDAGSQPGLTSPPPPAAVQWVGSDDDDGLAVGSGDGSGSRYEALLSGLTASPAADAGSDLMHAIMRAQHWRQVQSLLQEHGPECVNERHLCAGLTRLVHLQYSFAGSSGSSTDTQAQAQQEGAAGGAAGGAAAFIQDLYASIWEQLPVLQYRQACNVLWAASKLQHVAAPGGAWLAGMYRQAGGLYASELRQQHEQQEALPEAQQQAQQLGAQVLALRHTAQLAYALSRLRQHLPEQELAQCVSWVLSNTRQILQQHIQLHQPAADSEQRTRRPLKQWHQLAARDLATVAWSLASLGAEPSPAWLSACAAALSCRGLVSAGNYRDLSQLLWALASFSRHAAEGSAAAHSIHAAASAVLGAAQETPLASCDGQALANTLWALATLGQRPQLPYLNRLLLHAEGAASRGFLNPQGIAMVLWGLAALGVVPQASCMDALQHAAQQQLRGMTPQGLSNILWALAVLERPPSRDWLAAFWPSCRPLLPQMTSQGLVNCLWASARMGLQPPQEWLGDVAALLLQGGGLASLTSQGVSNVIWAMSRINIASRPGQLLSASLQQAVLMLEQEQVQDPQQQQQQQQAAAGGAAAPPFNIYELSGLMHAVCQLQQQQQPRHAAAPTPAPRDAAACATVLPRLTQLLQDASLPLLSTAAPSELAILLWSQVAMPGSAAGPVDSSSNSGASPASSTEQQQQQQQPAVPQAAAPPPAAVAAPPIPGPWMDAWFAGSSQAFNVASSRDLAQWMYCLALRGTRPPSDWLASWQVASFRQLGRASSQDLCNMLWALAALRVPPEPVWLQRHLWEVNRRQLQKQLLPQHYANLGVALAKLGHRPERDWSLRYQDDVVQLMPRLKPQELSNVLWALAQLNLEAQEELLEAAASHMSRQLPAYKPKEVAVSLWALSRLNQQPSLRLMGAALQHCFSQVRQLTPQGLSLLLWVVGRLEQPPPQAWVVKLLVATQVRMPGFSAQELCMLAVSLARLKYRPPDAWLDCLAAAAAARMPAFEAQGLANMLWAFSVLRYVPSEAWMEGFDAQLSRHVGALTSGHVAMTLPALARLGWLPAQPLWQQLQELAELHSARYSLHRQRALLRAVRVLQNVESEEDGSEDDVGAH